MASGKWGRGQKSKSGSTIPAGMELSWNSRNTVRKDRKCASECALEWGKNRKAGLGETHGFHRPSPPTLPHGRINLGDSQVVRVEGLWFKGFVVKT